MWQVLGDSKMRIRSRVNLESVDAPFGSIHTLLPDLIVVCRWTCLIGWDDSFVRFNQSLNTLITYIRMPCMVIKTMFPTRLVFLGFGLFFNRL